MQLTLSPDISINFHLHPPWIHLGNGLATSLSRRRKEKAEAIVCLAFLFLPFSSRETCRKSIQGHREEGQGKEGNLPGLEGFIKKDHNFYSQSCFARRGPHFVVLSLGLQNFLESILERVGAFVEIDKSIAFGWRKWWALKDHIKLTALCTGWHSLLSF